MHTGNIPAMSLYVWQHHASLDLHATSALETGRRLRGEPVCHPPTRTSDSEAAYIDLNNKNAYSITGRWHGLSGAVLVWETEPMGLATACCTGKALHIIHAQLVIGIILASSASSRRMSTLCEHTIRCCCRLHAPCTLSRTYARRRRISARPAAQNHRYRLTLRQRTVLPSVRRKGPLALCDEMMPSTSLGLANAPPSVQASLGRQHAL
jgi:hypothetical protein